MDGDFQMIVHDAADRALARRHGLRDHSQEFFTIIRFNRARFRLRVMAPICLAIGTSWPLEEDTEVPRAHEPVGSSSVERRRIKHRGAPPARHRRMICEWKQ